MCEFPQPKQLHLSNDYQWQCITKFQLESYFFSIYQTTKYHEIGLTDEKLVLSAICNQPDPLIPRHKGQASPQASAHMAGHQGRVGHWPSRPPVPYPQLLTLEWQKLLQSLKAWHRSNLDNPSWTILLMASTTHPSCNYSS